MTKSLRRWALLLLFAAGLPGLSVAAAADGGRLVSPQWLQAALATGDVLLLDASPAPLHAAKHIPGAVGVDVFSYAGREMPPAAMEQRLQRWGVSPGRRIVVMDQGGSYMAPRLFFDLYYPALAAEQPVPARRRHGRLAGRRRRGHHRSHAAPAARQFPRRHVARGGSACGCDEFLVASGDPRRNALVDALEPGYYYGRPKFFDRAGHVPQCHLDAGRGLLQRRQDLQVAGRDPAHGRATWASGPSRPCTPLRRRRRRCRALLRAPFLAGYPKVKLYKESQREWLQDERELPFWTYAQPAAQARACTGCRAGTAACCAPSGWRSSASIDVRAADAYGTGHLPYALNLPAEIFRSHLSQPERLAGLLGAAGVNAAHEAVVVSDGGLNPRAALAFLALEQLGQKRVSVLMDSVDEWGLTGFPLTRQPTTVGPRKSPQDLAVPVASYRVQPRVGVEASGARPTPRSTSPPAPSRPPPLPTASWSTCPTSNC